MAQSVSTKFINAQGSPANLPVAKVQLVLGNYASAAAFGSTATSDGDAPNSPAAGAIDGDRTEISAGPASVADNGIGQSVWASALDVTPGVTPTLTINFNATRIINRIKLYQFSGAPLTAYYIQYWTGSAWQTFAATSTSSQLAPTVFVTTHGLDVINFPDLTTTKIQVIVQGVSNNFQAQIVELEAYRVLDITARVKVIKVSRQRDYKLANPMAAQVQLDCINTDRFFSINHVPTAAEVAAGFVNAELRPNAQIVVQFGFNLYTPAPELVPSIVAYLDAITPNPKTRDCRITGRDGMKALINQTDSSGLKTNIELSAAIQYVLNRGNVSNYEMSLGLTNITLPFFFTDQEDHLTTIRNLTQAAGDSLFYYNESGVAVFQFYTGNLPLSFTYPTQRDWSSGAFTGNMEQNGSDQLDLVVQHTNPATYVNTQSHTVFVATFDNFAINEFAQSFELPYDTIVSNFAFTIEYSSNGDRAATFLIWADNGGTPGGVVYSTAVTVPSSGNVITTRGISVSPNLSLAKGKYWYGFNTGDLINFSFDGGTVDRATVGQTAPMLPAPYPRTLGQNPNQGVWKTLVATSDNNNPVLIWGNYTFLKSSGSGTWTSPVMDLGAGATAMSPLIPVSVPNGNTVQYLTQSSPDGVHWSGFVQTAGNGQPLSPLNRYFQVQVSMTQNPLSGTSALVLDLEVNWVGGLGTRKYPAAPSSFTFDYNSNLIDVSQELADNLGGDTSIINDVTVQAAPLLLTGANSSTVWQGTIGTPPINISGSAPLTVTAGTPVTVAPYISGGMDVSLMSGNNPAAAVVIFGNGAAGTWKFTFVSPTLPVLVITPTVSGTITDLRIVGKTFSSNSVILAAAAKDATSIQKFGDRKQGISNKWIASSQIAQVIANSIVSVFAQPFSYIPSFGVQPTFSMQIGDRVTVHDINLDLNSDYITVGIDHEFKVDGDRATVQTTGKLLAVPSGA